MYFTINPIIDYYLSIIKTSILFYLILYFLKAISCFFLYNPNYEHFKMTKKPY